MGCQGKNLYILKKLHIQVYLQWPQRRAFVNILDFLRCLPFLGDFGDDVN